MNKNMKKQYVCPLCEEIKVSATSEILASSYTPSYKYLNITTGADIYAD